MNPQEIESESFSNFNKRKEDTYKSQSEFTDNRRTFHKKATVDQTNVGYTKTIKTIFTKYRFVLCMLTISSLYFVVTGIQFWISDYCRVVLEVPKTYVFIMFASVSITAPTFGVIMGGRISSKLGGYTGKHAIIFCLINIILTSILAIPMPFIDNFVL